MVRKALDKIIDKVIDEIKKEYPNYKPVKNPAEDGSDNIDIRIVDKSGDEEIGITSLRYYQKQTTYTTKGHIIEDNQKVFENNITQEEDDTIAEILNEVGEDLKSAYIEIIKRNKKAAEK